MSDVTERDIALTVLKIGDTRYMPGDAIPPLDDNRRLRLIRSGLIKPGVGRPPAQDPAEDAEELLSEEMEDETPTADGSGASPESEEEDASGDDLIGELPEEDWPHHLGGGWYVLSDGSRIQGKADAESAEAELASED